MRNPLYNQPAFPMPLNETTSSCSPTGLTKLEYFTALAMHGISADPSMANVELGKLAGWSLNLAKATLDAIAKEQESPNP